MMLRNAALASLVALGLGASPFAASEPALAIGCASGALAGGVAGHYAGHHALVGAVGGCIVGHHMAVVQRRNAAAAATKPTAPSTPAN